MSAEDTTASGNDTGTDRGTIMLIALVILAVIASIIMLFSHSDTAMKVAVLAALWAAFLGLFLVARYRKVADDERARSETQRLQFESDLSRKQEEFEKKQLAAHSTKESELLEEIKGQLAELREQLEDLSGRQFGYEPAALLAEAHRIQEIEAVAADVEKHTHPVTAETEAIVVEREPREAPVDETAVLTPVPEPAKDASRRGKDLFDTGSFAAVKLDTTVAEEPVAPPTRSREEEVAHGRRRRDERSDSVSVAELLANLKKNK